MNRNTTRIELFDNFDVVEARQRARELAREVGFGLTDQTRIATAVSEVARQALRNQGQGNVSLAVVVIDSRRGLQCTCIGFEWLRDALNDPFPPSTDQIPRVFGGVEQLMDDFELKARGSRKIAVVMRKWLQ